MTNNNNSCSSSSSSSGDLFLTKIYRNKVIRKEIDKVKNQISNSILFNSRDELINSEKRPYLLSITISFNTELLVGDIPYQVESIIFTSNYRKEIKANVIPNGCKSLELPYTFNYPLTENLLPSSLTHLNLGHSFNQPLTNLPSNLVSLILSADFNQHLIGIPSSVQTLTFGSNFNKEIAPDQLPHQLRSLTLGFSFDHPLTTILPLGLQELTLGHNFNQVIGAGDLPSDLKSFTTGMSFNQELIDGVLPESLETLIVYPHYSFGLRVPLGVKRLEIDNIVPFIQHGSTIPSSVTQLSIGMSNVNMEFPNDFIPNNFIPNSVELLTIRTNFAIPITENTIPPSVRTISFFRSFNQIIHIPSTVKMLVGFNETKNRLKRNHSIPSTTQYINIREIRRENGESDSENDYTDEEDDEDN